MKKLYAAVWLLLAAGVAGSAALLAFMPDIIPAHYNFAGEVDRFGSKYEHLLFPAVTLLMGGMLLGVAKAVGKKGEAANEKVVLLSAVCLVGFLDVLSFYFGLLAIGYDTASPAPVTLDTLMKLTGAGVGLLLVVLGNFMPKARRNAWFGLRTSWSMANDRVWQKSQRFGGMATVACGFAMMLLSVLLPGWWNLLAMTLAPLVWLALCVVASRRYYQADAKQRESG